MKKKKLPHRSSVVIRVDAQKVRSFFQQYGVAVGCWVFFVLVISGVWLIQHKQLLSFHHLNCRVALNSCPDDIQAELNKELGESVFSSAVSKRAQKITMLVPSLHSFSVTLQFPDTATVTFVPAPTVYFLHDLNHSYLAVDESGTVVGEDPHPQLPVIEVTPEFYATLQIRARLDLNLHQELSSCLQTLSDQKLQFASLNLVSADELQVDLSNGKQAEVLPAQCEDEVPKLAYILKSVDFTSIKQPVRVIELRFKYPVLKT